MNELAQQHVEFIAYFELAESKMSEWQQAMDLQAVSLLALSERWQNELNQAHKLFTQTGIEQLQELISKTVHQSSNQLAQLQQIHTQFTQHCARHQEQLKAQTLHSIELIDKHCKQSVLDISSHLAKFDANQFHRIASESCDHVERVARDAVYKSNKLLNSVQLRFGFVATLITLLTAFIVVFYLSDELPWEMHHQAMEERQAGKVLLQAWPNLNQAEKNKILNPAVVQHA